ncbi:MAG: Clp protease N-terminal domain-containing protein [Gaiellaceae bacterium]
MKLLRRNASRLPTKRPGLHYLELGSQEARSLRHHCVGTEHVLLALLGRADSRAISALEQLGVSAADIRAAIGRSYSQTGTPAIDPAALATLGIDLGEVRRRVEETFGEGALERTGAGCMRVAPRLKRALERAAIEAGGDTIRDEHVLLGLLTIEDGFASLILNKLGDTVAAVRQALGPTASR